ncbi:MAG: Riboflavin biosynthesis protein RibD [Bacteroidota bacterium]
MLACAHVGRVAQYHVCSESHGWVFVQVTKHPFGTDFELSRVAARHLKGLGTHVKPAYVQVSPSLLERERYAATTCSQVKDTTATRRAFGGELNEFFGFGPRNEYRRAHVDAETVKMLKSKDVLNGFGSAEVFSIEAPALKYVRSSGQIAIQCDHSGGTLRVEFNPATPVGAGFFGREAVPRLEKCMLKFAPGHSPKVAQYLREVKHHRDETFMRRALDLAAQAEGFTHPNPLVGAVLVHDGTVIGEGYHHRAGEAHAEVMALRSVSRENAHLVPRATMYVTLEPCSHTGRTGPCSLALVEAGVQRIVVAHEDPNPLVSGRGIEMLRQAGRLVDLGILRDEAEVQNRRFFTSMREGRPYITLKWAQDSTGAVDGPRSAEHPGPWAISGAEAQVWTHRLRQVCGAILVGFGTWKADHPKGSVRAVAGASMDRFVWAARRLSDRDRIEIEASGWDIWEPQIGESADDALLRHLSGSGLRGLLVEGGPQTTMTFARLGMWDEAFKLVSPELVPVGGAKAPSLRADWQHVAQWGLDELQRCERVTFI